MKLKMGAIAAFMTLVILGSAAPSLQAQYSEGQYARGRDVLALQEDLNELDVAIAALGPRQRERFQSRVDEIRHDVTSVQQRLNNRGRWQTEIPRQEVDDLRTRVVALQEDVDRVTARRASRWSTEIPAGVEFDVRLESPVSTKTARVEQRVEATTVAPGVTVNGRTLIPVGTLVTGYVAEVDDADHGQSDGRIRLEFTGLQFSNGTRAEIRSRVVSVESEHVGRSTKKSAGLGALLGGVIGGIIDGGKGALIGGAVGAGGALVAGRGQDLELPEGAHLVLRLEAPVAIASR